ncbi:MAG: hypothetical protein ACLGHN_07975 [Bacteriovoracia bacterium]
MKAVLFSLSLITTQALANLPAPDQEDVGPLLEGHQEITSLSVMQKRGLNQGKTTLDLWSGSYWPHYQGSIGVRYRDPQFISLMDNKEQFQSFLDLKEKLPLYSYQGKENILSPAEKYDLLVGDSEMTLTRYSWELGEKNAVNGKVKTWRGLCDGWASASQKMPRPKKSVTLTTPNGLPLTFYPEDIKALGSLMYARSQKPVIFLGKRCRNQVIGLFTGGCAETNPGTFHRALVNRVGNLKKTFIADIYPGKEVWNYPIESYKVTFYNVLSDQESDDFEIVKEPFIKKNRFYRSSRRHEKTHAIVGVKLKVDYKDMRRANLHETDGPSMDSVLTMTYTYDLELDVNNNILGGESFSKNLPDFIWAPNDSTYPLSDAEEQTPDLSLLQLSRTAAKKGQPLSGIVEELFELAK